MTFKLLDLFSGIGGFSLGLESTGGFRTVAFCEIEPYCRRVLAKHWPGVPIHGDIRSLAASDLVGLGVDAICGGFPCQDISSAGSRSGIDGSRSGLWSEYARLIGELRPRVAIVENVAALLGRGIGRVLGDLAALGYDAEWHCIPASAVGAPHRRDRVWIVAHPSRDGAPEPVADAALFGCRAGRDPMPGRQTGPAADRGAPRVRSERTGADLLANADLDARGQGRPSDGEEGARGRHADRGGFGPNALADAERDRWEQGASALRWRQSLAAGRRQGERWWAAEPNVGRMAHGVSARVDRLRGLGNAVVPAVVEAVGRVVMEMGL